MGHNGVHNRGLFPVRGEEGGEEGGGGVGRGEGGEKGAAVADGGGEGGGVGKKGEEDTTINHSISRDTKDDFCGPKFFLKGGDGGRRGRRRRKRRRRRRRTRKGLQKRR